MRVEETAEFTKVRELSAKILEFKETDYIPHMSLFYGDLDPAVKIQIIREIGDFKGSFTVNKMYLVKNNEIEMKWEKIKGFRLEER